MHAIPLAAGDAGRPELGHAGMVEGLPAERRLDRRARRGDAGAGLAGMDGAARAQHSMSGRLSAGTVFRMAWTVHRPAAVPGTRQVPDLPDRAPLPAYPGSDTMGIPTTASGSGHDAGGYAVVSVPVAAGQRAGMERLRASGVTVRLLLADAPTFAPD